MPNLIKTKSNSKYWIEYLDKAIRPLVFIMLNTSGYVKTFKVKEVNKDKNNKLITNIEDVKIIKLNAFPAYDNRYIKTKIRTYGDKIYTNFRGFDVTEEDIECKSLTVIPLDFLPVYNKKCIICKYI